MWKLLHQPYPCDDPMRRRWAKAFWIGTFVGLFLLIFQPFGLNLWETPHKTVKILGFGVISFLATAFLSLLLPLVLTRQFTDERWTVSHEILWITAHITLIGLANYFYLQWLLGSSIYAPDLIGTIVVTFLIGIFPSAASVVVTYIIKLKKYSEVARQIPVREQSTEPASPATDEQLWVTLTAENEKDNLTLPIADLLYIESSDNYSTITYLNTNQPAKTLLRSSLSRLENQLRMTQHSAVVRCHRSFIVNLDKVEKVTGNAQGYKLHVHNGLFQIPVARKYNDTLIAQLKTLD